MYLNMCVSIHTPRHTHIYIYRCKYICNIHIVGMIQELEEAWGKLANF